MKYAKKIVHITISIIFAVSALAWAETGEPRDYSQPEQGNIIPESYPTSEEAIIDILRQIEIENFSFFNSVVTGISRDDNGLLSNAYYGDGTNAEYSYVEYEGELVTCEIKTNAFRLIIAKGFKVPEGGYTIKTSDGDRSLPCSAQGMNPDNSDDPYFLIIEPVPDDPDDEDPDGVDPIIVPLPGPIGREILDDASRDPLDHDFVERITDTIKGFSKDRDEAYNEYMKNTEPYYKKTYTTLKEKATDLKSEGFDLSKHFKGLAYAGTTEAEKRKLIDDAVSCIRRETENTGDEKVEAIGFLIIEKTYREKFLEIGKEIYDRKIEQILEYIDALIDELLGSRIGLYFNAKKDKMDVIISLPELTEEE